jgi:hypothetical protein
MDVAEAETVTDGVTGALITIVTGFEVAVVVVAQFALEVNTQVTTLPLVSAELVKILLFVPAFTPFTFH